MDALSMVAETLAVKPSEVGPASEREGPAADGRSAEQTAADVSPTVRAAAGGGVPSQPEQCSISDHSAATHIGSCSEQSSPCNRPLAWPCVLPELPALPPLDLRLPSCVPALARTELSPSPVAAETPPSPIRSDTSAKEQRLTGAPTEEAHGALS